MDILAIIKENLPDGVEVSEKALKAIEKEIKAEQGKLFIPKEQYSKKTERIDELEAQIADMQGKSADADSYKQKYEAEKAAHEATKSDYATKATITAKRTAARQALKALGAHDEDLDTFLLDKVDYEKVELDGDKVKDPKAFEGYKEQYKRYFGEIVVQGAGVATPPKGDSNAYTGKTIIELMQEANKNPDNAPAIMAHIETMNKTK